MELYKKILKSETLQQKLLNKDDKKEFISTGVFSLNLLFSGKVDGGIPEGLISMIAAPSQLGKSLIAYSVARNFQKKNPENIVVWIDSENAFDYQLAAKFKIDNDRLVVIRMNRIEDVEHEIVEMTNDLSNEERKKLLFIQDSWAALVTAKTMKDALEGSDKADMTEPKKKNRLAKIFLSITPSTFFIINGVIDNIGGYGDPLSIPGARRIYHNSQSVVLCKSKSKDKRGEDLNGAIIKALCDKSRDAKEKVSTLEYRINYNGGLDKFYGLLDDAVEGEYVIKPKNGRFSRKCVEGDKEWREKDIYCSEFWVPIFANTDFKDYLENKYSFKNTKIDMADDDTNI